MMCHALQSTSVEYARRSGTNVGLVGLVAFFFSPFLFLFVWVCMALGASKKQNKIEIGVIFFLRGKLVLFV